jgi:hypothetical protein
VLIPFLLKQDLLVAVVQIICEMKVTLACLTKGDKKKRVNSKFGITKAGVWISFSRHSPKWQVVRNFYSPNQKTTGEKYRKGQ